MGRQQCHAHQCRGHSHPSGDVKKICFENDAPYQSSTGGAQVWWINAWELGVTEPGSSGSPLFNQDHRIIGQLYGGAAACSGSVNNGAYDFYGRFDVSWELGRKSIPRPQRIGDLGFGWIPHLIFNSTMGAPIPRHAITARKPFLTTEVVRSMTPVASAAVTTALAVDAPMRRHATTTQMQSLTMVLASSEVQE